MNRGMPSAILRKTLTCRFSPLRSRGTSLSQEQQATLFAPGNGHRPPLDAQVDDRDRRGNGQRVGGAVPDEAAFDPVGAGSETHDGHPLPFEDHGRPAVEQHRLRPSLVAPGQGEVERAIGVGDEGERSHLEPRRRAGAGRARGRRPAPATTGHLRSSAPSRAQGIHFFRGSGTSCSGKGWAKSGASEKAQNDHAGEAHL